MRLWTIQPLSFWEESKVCGVMTPDPAKIPEQDFLPGYDWMRGQMAKHLPSFSGYYPIWAWLEIPGWCKPEKGDVILALEVPPDRVLVSDFSLWETVLAGWVDNPERISCPQFACLTGDEAVNIWEMMFSPAVLSRTEPAKKQACVDQVFLDEVAQVRLSKTKGHKAR